MEDLLQESAPRSAHTLRTWRAVQTVVWLAGVAILAALLFAPEIGIHAFWNVLIPVAPALVAFAPGLWRKICPLASTVAAWGEIVTDTFPPPEVERATTEVLWAESFALDASAPAGVISTRTK